MFTQRLGLYIFLGFISLSVAYKITPIVTQDGIPDFLNITTEPFVEIGNGYYFFESNFTMNWYNASESCRRMGANLIDFESIEEWNLIINYLNDKRNFKTFWTSASSLVAQGKTMNHVWFSTGQPMSLAIWYPGEPNNLGGREFCDEVRHLAFWGMNDAICYNLNNFICKAPKPATASFLVW